MLNAQRAAALSAWVLPVVDPAGLLILAEFFGLPCQLMLAPAARTPFTSPLTLEGTDS